MKDQFLMQNTSKNSNSDLSTYLGFLVVNLSTVKSYAVLIATNKLDSFSSLLSFGETSLVKSSALQVIYNLSLQDASRWNACFFVIYSRNPIIFRSLNIFILIFWGFQFFVLVF
uniref:Uncharacterized protein n=1 Tax=Meloidogyne incognita TaxID=6306 RepID=A0A914M165_MELIC